MAEQTASINPRETDLKPGQPGNHAGREFEPGNKIGKLGGRPKGLARRVREQVGEDGDLLINVMLHHATGWRLMVNPATTITEEMKNDAANWEKVNVAEQQAAVRWLAERGFGKPAEFVPVEEADPLGLTDAEDKTIAVRLTERLDEISAQRRRREQREAANE